MEEALAEFLRHLALEKNASAHTVKAYREDLTQALDFFRTKAGGEGGRVAPERVTTRLLRAYLSWLHEQGYARSTIARRVAAVRGRGRRGRLVLLGPPALAALRAWLPERQRLLRPRGRDALFLNKNGTR